MMAEAKIQRDKYQCMYRCDPFYKKKAYKFKNTALTYAEEKNTVIVFYSA